MESWEFVIMYVIVWIMFVMSFLYLYDLSLNIIALTVFFFTHVLLGSMVWFGDHENPDIRVFPTLMMVWKIPLKYIFMLLWAMVIVSTAGLGNKLRKLHIKYNNQDRLPMDLGYMKQPIEQLYSMLIASTVILLILVLFMLKVPTIQIFGLEGLWKNVNNGIGNNMVILVFCGLFVLGCIELYHAFV